MDCRHCKRPLSESQYRLSKAFKSCPGCSTKDGEEHVYYRYPDKFGTTDLRSSTTHPEGPQSHCSECRSDLAFTPNGFLCHEV